MSPRTPGTRECASTSTSPTLALEMLRAFAPWSICVRLRDEVRSGLGDFADCGYSVSAEVTPAEAEALQAALGGVPVLPLEVVHARQRAERASRRRQRRERLWAF